jgi:hypothetical protein
LNAGSGDVVVLKKLPNRIGAVNLESVIGTAKSLQQTEIVKCRADKQQLHIEFLPCLLSQFIGPEKDPMRVVKEQGCAELVKKSRRFSSQLRIRNAGLNLLELQCGSWDHFNNLR